MKNNKKDPGPLRKAFNKYVDNTASYIKGEQGFIPDSFTGGKPTKKAMASVMRKTAELIDPRNKATTNSTSLPSTVKAYPSKKVGKLKPSYTAVKRNLKRAPLEVVPSKAKRVPLEAVPKKLK